MISEQEFSYCPKCSGTLVLKANDLLVCQQCNLHYYINPKPCNAAILIDSQRKILLVKRKHNPKIGFWDFPGGFLDLNETIEDSMHREIKEELDIEIKELTYFTSFYDRYEFGEINSYTVCSVFVGTLPEDVEIHPSDDVDSVALFDPKDIPFETIAFEGIKKALRTYINK